MGLKYVDLKIIKMIKNPLFSHISTHTQTHTHTLQMQFSHFLEKSLLSI